MRWKTIGAALLVVIGVGAAAFAVIGPDLGGSTATTYLTSQATVTDVVEEVSATGTIEAATTYSLVFGSAPTEVTSTSATGATASAAGSGTSWIVETVTATVGQHVKAGDILATADTTDADLTLAVAEANLASAKARLSSDRKGLTATEKAAARLQVTQAQQSLGQAQSSYSSAVAQNALKIRQSEAAVARAKKAYEAARDAHQPAAVKKQLYDAWVQAKESIASLRLQASQSNTQAANQVASARTQVTSAQLQYKEKTARADAATLATDEASVAQAQQEVAAAKAALDYASLASPVDGVIVAVNVTPGLAAPSSQAITVRSAAFEVSASVTESDLPLLEMGQEATVTVTALDTDVTGTVTRVDQEATSSSFGVVSYAIVVSLPEAPEGTATGMTAELSITTESVQDVLAVPAIALDTATDGTYSVQVIDQSGQPQSVPVEVGLITTSLAQITSGLTEGASVVVGTASDRSTTTTTTTTGIPGLGGGGFQGGQMPGGFPGQRP